LKVNDEQTDTQVNSQGFVVIEREWHPGDKLTLSLPMSATLNRGYEIEYPDVDYFNESGNRDITGISKINNPFVSIHYGPMLFALPIPDATPNRAVSGTEWRYAVNVDPNEVAESIKIIHGSMPEH